MTVYTSYFSKIKRLPDDFIFFSIAGKPPEGYIIGKNGRFRSLPMFYPKYSWWSEWHKKFGKNPESNESVDFYTKLYKETVLKFVDFGIVSNTLLNCGGTPCLLCYERPEKFCHRHLVSRFLVDHGLNSMEFIA